MLFQNVHHLQPFQFQIVLMLITEVGTSHIILIPNVEKIFRRYVLFVETILNELPESIKILNNI